MVLSSDTYRRCYETLLACDEFQDYGSLRALFVTPELKPFRAGIPRGTNEADQVTKVIAYLSEGRLRGGRPVLPPFLRQLRDRYRERELYGILDALADQVRAELAGQGLADQLGAGCRIPEPAGAAATGAADLGPEIDWRGPTDEFELQSWLRPEPDVRDDVGFMKAVVRCAAAVCRIEDAQRQWHGTGFLIGPSLLLTNYHVLEPTYYGGPSLEENARDAVLCFGFLSAVAGEAVRGQTFKLDRDRPVLDASATSALDYVLLRVEDRVREAAGVEPVPYETRSPAPGARLTILHHPQGQPMKVAYSHDAVTGVYEGRGLVQYVNRTLQGSSGSPCFDDAWRVVALHHAQRSRALVSIREGILVGAIFPRIKDFLPRH
jgi:V8-like Glu-specific endopeptidase